MDYNRGYHLSPLLMKNIRTAIPKTIITNTTAEATPATKAAMSAREALSYKICVHVYMYIVHVRMVQFISLHKNDTCISKR